MKNQKYSEELDMIRTKAGRFYNSWKGKYRMLLDPNVNYGGYFVIFDAYFTLFVLYNIIYNIYSDFLEKTGTLKREANRHGKIGDREGATEIIEKEWNDSMIKEILHEKQEEIRNIISLIDPDSTHRLFHVNKDKNDEELLKLLKSSNDRDKFKGILKFLYAIRCNLFHGSKSYAEQQKYILNPSCEILEYIIDKTYEKMKSEISNYKG